MGFIKVMGCLLGIALLFFISGILTAPLMADEEDEEDEAT